MEPNELHLSLPNLTELDKLELEELFGEPIKTEVQPTPSGHLGEPGTLEAVIELSKFAIPTIGFCLSIFLVKGRHREHIVDKIEISNADGTFRRKLSISTGSEDAVRADVIKELSQAARELGKQAGAADSGAADLK